MYFGTIHYTISYYFASRVIISGACLCTKHCLWRPPNSGLYAELLSCNEHYFANKGPSSQGYGFSSGHVWMWELDCKEGWEPKNWCFLTAVLEKTLESPLDCKEIQPVQPKGNQSWIFIGRTDAKAETPTLASWCEEMTPWKRPWCWEKLGAGGEGDDRGWDGWMASLTRWMWVWVNSGSWWWTGRPGVLRFMGCKESDMTELLNWTELEY